MVTVEDKIRAYRDSRARVSESEPPPEPDFFSVGSHGAILTSDVTGYISLLLPGLSPALGSPALYHIIIISTLPYYHPHLLLGSPGLGLTGVCVCGCQDMAPTIRRSQKGAGGSAGSAAGGTGRLLLPSGPTPTPHWSRRWDIDAAFSVVV